MRNALPCLLLVATLSAAMSAHADIELPCVQVTTPPSVDGRGDDPAWTHAEPVTTRDSVADLDHRILCVHTDEQIFVRVRFPDADENREHKVLVWDSFKNRYVIGPKREDTLVLKWNMEPLFTDISLSADSGYKADVWFWKAVRTDPVGYADDKLHIYTDQPTRKATLLLSKSDREFYLSRRGDDGLAAYETVTPAEFIAATVPAYRHRQPQGSRADIRAKGEWQEGIWTVEFARKLVTGHTDDIQFSRNQRYQFGVSRYEVAGRRSDPSLEIPLYGSGEIGDSLILVFTTGQVARK